ncbi:sulfatase-like hydrolase/transferase, partial [Pirellulales bacterium]|nr:sulfatase-like hydrolase/transferase [Pirellulales bacterium]
MGSKLFRKLVESYDSRDEALRHFIQAYLASIASVDEQVGRILEVIDNTGLKDNTIIVLTSDHGWGMGEKDYLYKNSLWQESTRIPLIIRAPGIAPADTTCDRPVSLVDIYPTLCDLCNLEGDTMKNEKGHPLDGHSFRPLLEDPASGTWTGPDEALTALYKWRMKYNPHEESYSLRSNDWRYIRYENGKEEL